MGKFPDLYPYSAAEARRFGKTFVFPDKNHNSSSVMDSHLAILDAYQQEMAQLTQRGQTPPSQEPSAPEMTM